MLDDGAISGTTIIEFALINLNSWTAPTGLAEFEVFVVGGGGGGGYGNAAGGGGAGGITMASFTNINGGQGFSEETVFAMNVGVGGGGAGNDGVRGQNGTPSIFGMNSDFVTVAGGGTGGGSNMNPSSLNVILANLNASSGGASGLNSVGIKNGSGNGGSPRLNNSTGGGGGGYGGMGLAGTLDPGNGANINATGGNGGAGFPSNFRGNTRTYAAGGGGNTTAGNSVNNNEPGKGGSGVGGDANRSGIGGAGRSQGSGGGAGTTFGGAGSSGVIIIRYPNFRILPVEYLYFDSNFKREDKLVELKWATAKELENSYFEIQRSFQNVKNWEWIGKVDGMGWSDSPVEYLFKDPNLPLIGGMAYYRLKQVDFNGNFDLSKTVSVRLPSLQHFEGVWRVFPNPNDGEKFSLELLDENEYRGEALRVRLISPKATAIAYTGNDLREISELIRAQLAKSPKGLYIVEVSWGQKVEYLKVLRK